MSLYLRVLSVGLAGFWLLLSGFWDNTLLLVLGLASIILAVYLSYRIERVYPLHTVTTLMVRIPPYAMWLLGEIIKTNLDVVKSIWMPQRFPISPALGSVPMTQTTRLGKTLYANSITLTPGTVTVRLEPGQHLLVHALTSASLDELKAGDMDARVTELEK